MVVDVEDVLNNPNSPSNYILKNGDIINVPKEINVVSIHGFINANETLSNIEISEGDLGEKVNVPYHKGKNAKFYIDYYAGGVNRAEGARYSLIKVKQPGGKLKKTKNYGFFKRYPEVKKGAIIIVEKREKSQEEKDRKKVDWASVISNTVAQATAILTLVILIQNLDGN